MWEPATMLNPLEPIERLVLENLAAPVPGECRDVEILRRLEQREFVRRVGDKWVITAAGRMKLQMVGSEAARR
jgi:hypothetical protein